jgi:hypothetical protein
MNDPNHLPLPYPTLPDDEEERDLERLRLLGLSPATDLFGVMLELDRLEDRDVQKASSTPSSKLPEGSS